MATIRTPNNPTGKQNVTPEKAGADAGHSTSSVRRSIGEWETTTKLDTLKTRMPTKSPSAKVVQNITIATRTQEARNQMQSAKKYLAESRNLKTDIKEGVTQAINRLYQLVKEAEEERTKTTREVRNDEINKELTKTKETEDTANTYGGKLVETMERLIKESERRDGEIEKRQKVHIEKMEELKRTIEAHGDKLSNITNLTYAEAAASGKPIGRPTLHSVIVTAKDETETGEQVIERVKKVMKAKEGGIEIDRIRKTKDRKVIISCATKKARQVVKERIEGEESALNVEEVRNRDPLLVLKDVLQSNSDEDVIRALRNQNGDLFSGLNEEENRVEVKFRRRARNPHACHVVLTVSPELWKRATGMGAVRIDIQRIRVEDQSPLIQCSICLGYGHGKKYCKEKVEKCSHCEGPHMRAQCEQMLAGLPPSCTNCHTANMRDTEHNAFSAECPIRKKWDALARARVAYC